MRWRPRRDREHDLERELRSDLELEAEEQQEKGLSPEKARYAARRAFGNATYVKEELREMWGWAVWERFGQDLRYAVRVLRKSPLFAATAVLTLGLGIGANTALFSVLDGLLLRLLPVENPRSLVVLRDASADRFPYPAYELLKARSRLLSGVAGIQFLPGTLEITDRGQTPQVAMQAVSGNYFQVFGVHAARGRMFELGNLHVAVISDSYWRAHYHASPDAQGAHFQRLEWDYTIIGIAPPGFHGVMLDAPADIFIPLEDWVPKEEPFRSRGRIVSVMARMGPGVTPPQAAAEASALLHRTIRVERGGTGISALRQRIASPLLVLDFLVAFVLLIACSNLANLSLASAATRQREMAVRQAIGAVRACLVRQLLTESALLALAGGVLAVLAAQWISRVLLLFLPPNSAAVLPNLLFRPDAHVLVFTGVFTVAACLLFGLAPALKATRSMTLSGLRQAGSGSGSGWLSRGLVVCEVGLCTAVLMTAGLFVRTLRNLQNLDPALAPEQVVVVNIPTPRGYTQAARLRAFDDLRERAASIPGVRAAGYVHVRPLTGQGLDAGIQIPGSNETLDVLSERVSPGFLPAVGIPLVKGRDFVARDDAASPPVAIVNELFARQFLPGQSAIGHRFTIAGHTRDIVIVGVVKDTRWLSLREPPVPMFYEAFSQDSASFCTLAIRSTGNPGAVAVALQSIARDMHPPLTINDVVPFTELEDRALFTERMIAQVSAAFGLLALLIACAGLYGLLSYGVVRRTREIGIRMALGASRAGVQWLVLRESTMLLALGVAVGVPTALGASRFAASLLFGLTASDPATTGAALTIMTVTALGAACLPARRAVRVDPMAALREE
jgi:predicted permease